MNGATTFFFYDLETTGTDPKRHRILQFAGQRTDMELRPIGEPVNLLVRLADDVLPEPGAVLTCGLTPQMTSQGLTESELLHFLENEVMTPGTIMTGFNNVRFDDEFMRFCLYRSFCDPYEWCWKDGRSRWDLLDVVRMTRALRPEGIEWPVAEDGSPINTLVGLSAANGITHTKAHDALSDVEALIDVARLIKSRQPRLWDYLLRLRNKREVESVIHAASGEPFVYSSGMYGRDCAFTTVGMVIGEGAFPGSYRVYDLRHDPAAYAGLSVPELRERLFTRSAELAEKGLSRLPVKELGVNKCPAVAPLGTLTDECARRLGIDRGVIQENRRRLLESDLAEKVAEVYAERREFEPADCDGALYEGFISEKDGCAKVRAATSLIIGSLEPRFRDRRLPELFIRYKARNFPQSLSDIERKQWEDYRAARMAVDLVAFRQSYAEAWAKAAPDGRVLLAELSDWVGRICPGYQAPVAEDEPEAALI